MRIIGAILRLTRFDSSAIGFLAVLVPFLARTSDLADSFGRAIPLLFISMATYIANDLDDMERDEINHPDRPLPARHLNPSFAAVLYFVCLGAALLSIRHYIDPEPAFLYYALVALAISYGYVVESLPGLKAPYVAAMLTAPILIVAMHYPAEVRLLTIAAGVFLFTLGRELCMDLIDRVGDTASFMNRFKPGPLAIAAFALQFISFVLLAVTSNRPGHFVSLSAMALLFILSASLWFRRGHRKISTWVMKAELMVGLYFLT